jgi:hypothetical protein
MSIASQCDQTFCEKSDQNCPNIAQIAGLLNKNIWPEKFLVEI